VFRLLRGGSAHDLVLRDGPLGLDRVDRLVMEIGSALVTAHAAGVVHRDVKPDKVLFDDAGNTYLADFGIAVSDVEPAADLDPSVLPAAGSPLYAAPEQFRRTAPSAQGDQLLEQVVLESRPDRVGRAAADLALVVYRRALSAQVDAGGQR
jgi:serine/threonine protein kinase